MKIELVEQQGLQPPHAPLDIYGDGQHLGYVTLNSLDSLWRTYLFPDSRKEFFRDTTPPCRWFTDNEGIVEYLEGRLKENE